MRRKDETQQFFAGTEGCPEHGEDALQVCPTCGEEFCARCHPGVLCPDCGLTGDEDDDEALRPLLADEADEDEDIPADLVVEMDDEMEEPDRD